MHQQQDALSLFARHTPRLLRRQLILQLAEQYLGGDKSAVDKTVISCMPSIQRFHGALLFVDISGFTALSLKLNVEELKNHINEYFTKMLDIVDKHDGDVIKFAGDALFIVWESVTGLSEGTTTSSSSGSSSAKAGLEEQAKAAVARAVECGKEINDTCGNHRVVLGSGGRGGRNPTSRSSSPMLPRGSRGPSPAPSSPHSWADIGVTLPKHGFPSLPHLAPLDDLAGATRKEVRGPEEEVAYLNVHSGVSVGLMAGIDIGADNRWEYFLIGEPLSKVAEAEGQASSGDMILCPESHAMFHGGGEQPGGESVAKKLSGMVSKIRVLFRRESTSSSLSSGGSSSGKSQLLACGCTQMKGGYCRLAPSLGGSHDSGRQKKVRQQGTHRLSDLQEASNPLLDGIRADVDDVYHAHQARFAKEFAKLQSSLLVKSSQEIGDERLQPAFARWALGCLTDDVARHVHAVVRSEYSFSEVARAGSYLRVVEELIVAKSVSLTSAPGGSIHWEDISPKNNASRLKSPGRLGPLRVWSPGNSRGNSRSGSPTNAKLLQSNTVPDLRAEVVETSPTHATGGKNSPLHSSTSLPMLVPVPKHSPVPVRGVGDSPTMSLSRPSSISPSPANRLDVLAPIARVGASPGVSPMGRSLGGSDSPYEGSPANSRPASVDGEDKDRVDPSSSSSHSLGLIRKISSGLGGVGESAGFTSGRNALRRRDNSLLRSSLANNSPSKSSTLAAEIRTVTVMFVKILMPDVELLVDKTRRQRTGGAFRFLGRTVNETISDQLLLDRFQTSMEVLTEAFAQYGGQMRQFIVDDKGTVCIGTFGLRGAVSDDNAAAALEAANMILLKMQSLSLQCSIGVTVGTAYCGLVGSDKRHEYAVMGPSTNLSARLMCKAPPYGVICDVEARQRDRTHGFLALDDIVAKGYAQPVGTFIPVFPDVSNLMAMHHMSSTTALLRRTASTDDNSGEYSTDSTRIIRQLLKTRNVFIGGAAGEEGKMDLHGRDKEVNDLVGFLFTKMLVRTSAASPMSSSRKSPSTPIRALHKVFMPGSPAKASHKGALSSSPPKSSRKSAAPPPAPATATAAATLGPLEIEEVRPTFDHLQPTRCAGIVGNHGIGKSCLAASIMERLAVVAKSNEGCNVHIFKSRFDNFNMDLPFNAWKPIIVEMLTRMYRIRNGSPPHRGRKSFRVGGLASSPRDVNSAVEYVVPLLPPSLQYLRPLFGYLTIVPPDESVHNLKFTLSQKLTHCIDLLVAVIQLYTSTCKTLAAITMEDLHAMDKPSLRLLVEVCAATTGVVVLFTGRTAAARKASRFDHAMPGHSLQDLTATLRESDRYLEVDLQELNRSAIGALVGDVLRARRVTDADPNLSERVFEACGGNPFYAAEIAKSVCEHRDRAMEANFTALHCIRIEEVICHRFDQLKNSAQSLLKMAAVACSNGAGFTLDLLSELDEGDLPLERQDSFSTLLTISEELPLRESHCSTNSKDSQATTSTKLAKVLHHILSKESFLRVAGGSSSSSSSGGGGGGQTTNTADPPLTLEGILAGNHTFEFSIALEQSTIYNLLLEDQKHAIHEGIAEYRSKLHSSRTGRGVAVTAADLQEEGFHWWSGCAFSRALTCYHRAHVAETNAERRSEWLSRAYSIYVHLKESTELVPDPVGVTVTHLSMLFDDTFENEGRSQADVDASSFTSVLTLERVFQIFDGDSDLLSAGLEVLLAVADERMRRFVDSHKTQLILEDTLQYVLLTKHPFLMSTKYLSMLINKVSDSGDDYERVSSDEMHFHLRDFWRVAFRALTAYVLNDALSTAQASSGEYLRKVAFVATQSVQLARKERLEACLIHSLCAEGLLFYRMGDSRKAAGVIDELHSLYSNEVHSPLLIDSFGINLVPSLFATAAGDLLLARSAERADDLVLQCIQFVPHCSSGGPSVALCVLPLIAYLAYRSRYLEAYEMLISFEKLSKGDVSHADEQIPKRVVHLYFEWLSARLKLSVGKAGGGAAASIGGEEWSETTHESGILGHHQLEVDLVLADLWVLRSAEASASSSPSEVTKCCHSCATHMGRVLRNKTRGVAQHFFSTASAVKAALDLHAKVPTADCLAELRKVFTLPVVADLKLEAHQSHLEALCEDLERLQHLLFVASSS